MAEIKFYANVYNAQNVGGNDGVLINHTAGSGIGFYGNNFGISVPIGAQQTTTFVTNALGTSQGIRLNNTAFATSGNSVTQGTVRINGASPQNLSTLPNFLCPLNIRFTHNEPVKVQNCRLRIFDRNNINNHASGVVTYVYEARHPSPIPGDAQLSHRGISDGNYWFEFDPAEPIQYMTFTSSPGASGTNSNGQDSATNIGAATFTGSQHESTRHDWFVALSSEPVTVGSKTQYGLYFTLEYL